jgi:hypothetical protein
MNSRTRFVRRLLPALLVTAGVARCAPVDGYGYDTASPVAPGGYEQGYDPGYQPYYAQPGYAQPYYAQPDYSGGAFFGFGGGDRGDFDRRHSEGHDRSQPERRAPGAAPAPPPSPGAFRPPPSMPQRPALTNGSPMPQHPSFAAPAPPPRLGGAPPVRPKRPGEP